MSEGPASPERLAAENPRPAVLVTGAGGFVGRHLVLHLKAKGYRVTTLSRGVPASDPSVFVGPADPAAIETSPNWPPGIEAVVHLGALNPGRRDPAAGDLPALRRANVLGTAALARRAAREGVRRMVFVGSAAVHAPNGETPIREDAPIVPRTPYALSKAEAEEAFREAIAGTAMEGCVLRPVPVFGPGAGNLTALLARLARSPFPLPLEGLGAPRSLLSVDDLVEAIRLAIEADGAAGHTFLLANDGPLTPAGIVRTLREGSGRLPRLLPVPGALLGRLAALAGRGEAWTGATGWFVVDAGAAGKALGWRPEHAEEALRRMSAQNRM